MELFLSLLMLFFSPLIYFLLSISFFISFRNLLGSILSSQTDLPTLKNVDFMMAGARFLKNHHFRSKNGFENVWGLPRASFGSSWGALGGLLGALGSSLGPLDRPKRASRFVLELSWASFARFLLPKMALGRFWGRLWLVLSAPEAFLGVFLCPLSWF